MIEGEEMDTDNLEINKINSNLQKMQVSLINDIAEFFKETHSLENLIQHSEFPKVFKLALNVLNKEEIVEVELTPLIYHCLHAGMFTSLYNEFMSNGSDTNIFNNIMNKINEIRPLDKLVEITNNTEDKNTKLIFQMMVSRDFHIYKEMGKRIGDFILDIYPEIRLGDFIFNSRGNK
jgi:6-pyruvoyl-tetrahydropterin synthase